MTEEPDPMSVNVGMDDPANNTDGGAGSLNSGSGGVGLNAGGWAGGGGPTCYIDGIEMPDCTEAFHMMERNTGSVESDNPSRLNVPGMAWVTKWTDCTRPEVDAVCARLALWSERRLEGERRSAVLLIS
jgi:hypothetical protein